MDRTHLSLEQQQHRQYKCLCLYCGVTLADPLPTVIFENAYSFFIYIEELHTNVKFLTEYRNTCLLAITETWLKNQDLQSDLEIDKFGEPQRLNSGVTQLSVGKHLCHQF